MLPCAIELSILDQASPRWATCRPRRKRPQAFNQCKKRDADLRLADQAAHRAPMLRAGMSALTDHADPSLTWLPSGHARWCKPGLQPHLEEEWSRLEHATEANHLTVVQELESTVPLWSDCDDARRRTLVNEWTERWKWRSSLEETLEQFSGETPPACAPKMIGHRGSERLAGLCSTLSRWRSSCSSAMYLVGRWACPYRLASPCARR